MATNRTVIITGASSGIGLATARLYASKGWTCLLVARDAARLETIAEQLRDTYNVPCLSLIADVRNMVDLRASCVDAIATHPPDHVIANAGIGQYGPFHRSPWEHIDTLLRTNIDGAMAIVRLVAPGMVQRRHGSIVLVSSTLGKRAMPWNAAYCASKYALHGFADALRLELRPFGVHVGVLCPARTDTPFFDRMTMSVPRKRERHVPTSSPERVAKAIVRCASKRRREVTVSFGGKFYAFIGVHFPRFADFVLSIAVPRPEDE